MDPFLFDGSSQRDNWNRQHTRRGILDDNELILQEMGVIPRSMLRVSPLQSKGILTLCLLLLAESVTVSNAAKVFAGSGKEFRQNSGSDSPVCVGTDPASCASSTVLSSAKPNSGKANRKFSFGSRRDLDCCSDCRHCLETGVGASAILSQCAELPRGGSIEAAASATASSGIMPLNLPLNAWKVIFQALLTTLNVLCWLIPLRSKKISDNKLALSLANAFSGGVFLSLAFGHLIPECVHGFEGFNEVTPYLLVLSGYLLIFFVEKVAFDAHEIMHEMEHAQEKRAQNGEEGAAATSGRSALILLGALAVHSVLEMTALGLADTFGDSAILSLSIALHQPAESIALLVAFLKSGLPKGEIIRFLSVFSAMGPIGVAIGMAVNEFAAPIIDSIMVAVVAGTFVYVGATEVIPEEWEDSEHKWKKFFALMGGIISILIITQYTATLEM